MTVGQAGLSNKYIDETVSRMAALTASLFEPVPTFGFHDQDAKQVINAREVMNTMAFDEHMQVASEGYDLWRTARQPGLSAVDELGAAWRESYAAVAGHAQIVPQC